MTAQDLKNAVLQLAVQGKLVPQDPADEPASELLKRVCVKKKPTLIDRETMPFDIPDSWQWSYISEVGELIRGVGIKRSETVDKGFPCVRYGELYTTYETAFTETASFIPETVFKLCKQINHGDLLMTLTGENKPDIAKTIAYVGTAPIAVGGDLAYWTKHGMNPLYLSYLMASPYAIERKVALATGNMIVHISGVKLGTIPIPIPPLAEQARIVAKIEKLLPYIEEYDATEKRLTALNKKFPDQLRKSILQQAIMGKLTERDPADEPASELLKRIRAEKAQLIKEGKLKREKPLPPIIEDDIPFEIPEGWEWVRFSNLMLSFSTGPFGTMLHKSDYIQDGIPLVNPANIVGKDIVLSKKMMVSADTAERLNAYRLEPGMLVMGRRGEMGRCAVVSERQAGWLCGTGSFFMRPAISLCVDYLLIFFSTSYAKKYLEGESVGSTMNNLNHKILMSIPVPLPPLAEQQRIVERVEELLAVCGQ